MMRSWTWCRGRVIIERFRQEGGLTAPSGAQGMHDPAADIQAVQTDTVRARPQASALNR